MAEERGRRRGGESSLLCPSQTFHALHAHSHTCTQMLRREPAWVRRAGQQGVALSSLPSIPLMSIELGRILFQEKCVIFCQKVCGGREAEI